VKDLDQAMGLYKKYEVTRHDPDGKHKDCFYFVLDMNHDIHAIPALKAYIESCRADYPALAADLTGVLKSAEIRGK
jgi:hypothetical protein